MKTLLALRHAKSSWAEPGLADHERPLNRRGLKDAPRMGRLLIQLDLVPERIFSSTALRAKTTAEIVSETCGFGGQVELTKTLYLCPPEAYLQKIRQLCPAEDIVMMVGHNPSLEELIELTTGQSASMPTAALARLDFDLDDWSQLSGNQTASLVDVWIPKELDDAD